MYVLPSASICRAKAHPRWAPLGPPRRDQPRATAPRGCRGGGRSLGSALQQGVLAPAERPSVQRPSRAAAAPAVPARELPVAPSPLVRHSGLGLGRRRAHGQPMHATLRAPARPASAPHRGRASAGAAGGRGQGRPARRRREGRVQRLDRSGSDCAAKGPHGQAGGVRKPATAARVRHSRALGRL